MNKIKLTDAKCTKLSFDAAVKLAKDNDTLTGFELDGYTGAAVDRWWGKLVIDLSGITAKQRMPIFLNHNSDKIVGHSISTSADDIFRVSGVFSKSTEAAREVMALAAEDFPWQASIGVSPKAIMELKDGVTMQVNGFELTGPAEVWTQSEVSETSFVPLGADSNTSATVFSNIEEVAEEERAIPPTIRKDDTMNLQELKDKHPELVAEIVREATSGHDDALKLARSEGAEAERLRIKAVHEQAYPGHEELISTAMFDGESLAGDVAIAINKANLAAQLSAGEQLSSDAPEIVPEPVNNGELTKNDGPVTKEKLEAEWSKNPALRAEFGGDLESYLALEMPGDGVKFKTLSKSEEK